MNLLENAWAPIVENFRSHMMEIVYRHMAVRGAGRPLCPLNGRKGAHRSASNARRARKAKG